MATYSRDGKGYKVRWRELVVLRDERGNVTRRWANRSRKAPDVETAKKLCRAVEQTAAIGERWTPESERASSTLDNVFGAFLDDRRRRLAFRTIESYARYLDAFLSWLRTTNPDPLLPSLLSARVLATWHEELERTGRHPGRPRGADAARRHVEAVQLAWKWASNQDEYVDEFPRPRDIDMRRGAGANPLAPTWEEMDKAIGALEPGSPQQRATILMRFTGLRVQQVMRLLWSDLDLDRAYLVVRPELGKSPQERRGRIVPISQHVVDLAAGWPREETWVIPTFRKAGVREREFRARDVGRAWERAGVRPEVWKGRPDHAFRKGLRSNLKAAGADSDAVEHLIGHAYAGPGSPYLDPSYLPNRAAVGLIPPLAFAPLQRPLPGAWYRRGRAKGPSKDDVASSG